MLIKGASRPDLLKTMNSIYKGVIYFENEIEEIGQYTILNNALKSSGSEVPFQSKIKPIIRIDLRGYLKDERNRRRIKLIMSDCK